MSSKVNGVACLDSQVGTLDAGRCTDCCATACPFTERTSPCDVVGVDVCIETVDQLQVQGRDDLQVPLDLLEDSVDEHGLTTLLICQEVGEGTGVGVEELSEDHHECLAAGVSCWTRAGYRISHQTTEPSSM